MNHLDGVTSHTLRHVRPSAHRQRQRDDKEGELEREEGSERGLAATDFVVAKLNKNTIGCFPNSAASADVRTTYQQNTSYKFQSSFDLKSGFWFCTFNFNMKV